LTAHRCEDGEHLQKNFARIDVTGDHAIDSSEKET
jgi:hypothetical protein